MRLVEEIYSQVVAARRRYPHASETSNLRILIHYAKAHELESDPSLQFAALAEVKGKGHHCTLFGIPLIETSFTTNFEVVSKI